MLGEIAALGLIDTAAPWFHFLLASLYIPPRIG
jgi:hypothetical protein